MTIAKADILTEVRNRTGRGTSIADIDDELLMVMLDISSRIPAALQTSASVTVLASAKSASLPTDFVIPIGMWDPSGNPMTLISFMEYQNYLKADATEATTISVYAVFDDTVYVYPTPSAQMVFTMFYSYEEDAIGSIGFEDVFKFCLIEGVCFHVEAGLGVLGAIPEQAITHYTLYEAQIKVLQARYAHRQI